MSSDDPYQPGSYPRRAVIVVPADLAELSAVIAGAMGTSEADARSFDQVATDSQGAQYVVCDTPLTEATYHAWGALSQSPTALHAALVQRGADVMLAEVQHWLARSTIWLGDAWALTRRPVGDVVADLWRH
jgi:3-polyprenyl-4-hydroxybenzoate decarboxylase